MKKELCFRVLALEKYRSRNVIEEENQVYTDGYNLYNRVEKWGYKHKIVNSGKGEHARDEDGGGFYEVHVNTMKGFWSLLGPPHRGISQSLPRNLGEKLPYCFIK